jgi:hypothetical protein
VELSIGPSQAIDARDRGSTITIVEQEDVAFSLGLCHEVHRIYGDYLQGRVSASESLEAGLMMSIEMLAVLSRNVNTGMPAMRIGVAASELTEMLAVMFDQNWVETPLGPKLRTRYRELLAEPPTTPELEPVSGPAPAPRRRGLSRLLRRTRK